MLRVFTDSDVVISSLISQKGAAYFLLNQAHDLKLFLSNISTSELEKVTDRLELDRNKLIHLIKKRFSILTMEETTDELKKLFAAYVIDPDDAHIVAGAKAAHAQFLISYNIKHFKADKLKQDFNIILTTPAMFLQYLRSL